MPRVRDLSDSDISRAVSAFRAADPQPEGNASITDYSGLPTKEAPAYSLASVDFNEETRVAFVAFNETSTYRTIKKYVTRDYVRYPVYTDWKTKTKQIRKTINLSNERLESLRNCGDPLISDFAKEILASINLEDLFPSWFWNDIIEDNFRRDCEANEAEYSKNNYEHSQNAVSLGKDIGTAYGIISECESEIGSLRNAIERQREKIRRIQGHKKTFSLGIFALSMDFFFRIPERIEKLEKLIVSEEEAIKSHEAEILSQKNAVSMANGEKGKEEEAILFFKGKYEEKRKSTQAERDRLLSEVEPLPFSPSHRDIADRAMAPAPKDDFLTLRPAGEEADDVSHGSEKYVVLDVETTGLSVFNDDMLSLSLFDPHTGNAYDHYFPLFRMSDIPEQASEINGLTRALLKKKNPSHWTQEAFDRFVEVFGLENRTILTYSNFDSKVIRNYMESHSIRGFERLHFFNFKKMIVSSGFAQGVTKDNLCLALGISGVCRVHSGLMDCFLEWNLFKKIDNRILVVVNYRLYAFEDGYLIPASQAKNYRNTAKLPFMKEMEARLDVVKEFKIDGVPKERDTLFDTYSFDGFLVETAIRSELPCSHYEDREQFGYQNNKLLEYLGALPKPPSIGIAIGEDGRLKADRKLENEEEEKELERSIKNREEALARIKRSIKPLIDYLVENTFASEPIIYQELVKRPDLGSFGYCDFSSASTIVELKNLSKKDCAPRELSDRFFAQLFITSNGRQPYLLTVEDDKAILYKAYFVPFGSVYRRRGNESNGKKKPDMMVNRGETNKMQDFNKQENETKQEIPLTEEEKKRLAEIKQAKQELYMKEYRANHRQELLEKHREYNKTRRNKN